ncbi:MAG: hypothetical protein FK730_03970 [Asgard group archaeon]|nr:hypothetical protein [Asgard group archaeon]
MRLLYPFSSQTGYLFGYWTSNIAMISLSVMFAVGVIIIVIRLILRRYLKRKETVDKDVSVINSNDVS